MQRVTVWLTRANAHVIPVNGDRPGPLRGGGADPSRRHRTRSGPCSGMVRMPASYRSQGRDQAALRGASVRCTYRRGDAPAPEAGKARHLAGASNPNTVTSAWTRRRVAPTQWGWGALHAARASGFQATANDNPGPHRRTASASLWAFRTARRRAPPPGSGATLPGTAKATPRRRAFVREAGAGPNAEGDTERRTPRKGGCPWCERKERGTGTAARTGRAKTCAGRKSEGVLRGRKSGETSC